MSLLLPLLSVLFLGGCQSEEEVKRSQYLAEGYQLYQTHCANCHQADGSGLGNLYPPIVAESLQDKATLICWIKHGINRPMVIEGITYSRPMPANPTLKDLEIAEIVTYMTDTWGNDKDLTSIESVQNALNQCDLSTAPKAPQAR
ncbi:MAG: c-type cytochrome [Runella sp.]